MFSGNTPAILLLSALSSTALVIGYHLILSIRRKGEASMIWSWIPILGNAIEFGQKPVTFLQEAAKKYGEIFGFIVGGNRMFIISDCHSANTILRHSKQFSVEDFHNLVLCNFFGVSRSFIDSKAVNSDLMKRWYNQYLLSEKHLFKLNDRMQIQLLKNVKEVKDGVVNLNDFMSRFIFNASVAALLNEEAGDDKSLFEAFVSFDKQMPIALAGAPMNMFKEAFAGRDTLFNAINRYTKENCELLTMRHEYFMGLFQDKATIERQLGSWQLPIIWASVGNTMPATFWVIYYLLKNPVELKKLLDEIKLVVKEKTSETEYLSSEDLNKMVFADACITEALRLSSGSLIMRIVTPQEGCQLTLNSGNTYSFRKGDRIGICPPLHHLDEEIFPNATEFQPARWMKGETDEERAFASVGKIPLYKDGKEIASGAGFMPFGAGGTICPGRRFARAEVKALMTFLLTRFEFLSPSSLAADEPAITESLEWDGSRAGLGIFPPKTDVPVYIRKIL